MRVRIAAGSQSKEKLQGSRREERETHKIEPVAEKFRNFRALGFWLHCLFLKL
jgi:hypothetical protein